ncbi:MAG: cysteine hydrolase family protein [Phototrophicaceae bacterium]
MIHIVDNAALILVDVQQGFSETEYFGGNRNNPDAESNMKKILDIWRSQNRPIFHIKHNSTEPNSPLRPNQIGNEIQVDVAPQGDEPLIGKTVNSAFIGTDLEQRLHDAGINQVVIVGLTTNHCVSTTTRMAGNLGFDTILIADATATFDRLGFDGTLYPAQLIHDTAIANLHEEFATILNTERLLQSVLNE